MTEPLRLQGRWWLPESDDHRVFGTLTWTRIMGKWVAYADRIEQSVDLAGRPFLDLVAANAEHRVQTVVNTRDDLAHHRERFKAEGSAGDHILAEQLFWLFAICMLRLARAPEVVYEGISRHAHRWLTEQARSLGSRKT
ncbi:MAG TPA: hypothetical protein VK390_16770 [Propionibacteriaceae bacterium]|nr:hypothetical protein [Propionibacteriaceae bacterium]